MGPPFLAYYGLLTANNTLLQSAYDQIRLYRDALRLPDGPGMGLWAHIRNETSWIDAGAWATGNGWVAAGMMRVLASLAQAKSGAANNMTNLKSDLVAWTAEILDSAYPFLDANTALFHNYINDTSTFLDASGSAAIAYATYRLASIAPSSSGPSHIPDAERIYASLQGTINHLGNYGGGVDVVDALRFTSEGSTSSESLSFLLLLEAARRDHTQGNVTGLDGPGSGFEGAARMGVNAPTGVKALVALVAAISWGASLLL